MSSRRTTKVAAVILCAGIAGFTAISLTACNGDDSEAATNASNSTSGRQPGPPAPNQHEPGGTGISPMQDPNAPPPRGG